MFRLNLRKYSTPSGKLLGWASAWALSGDFVVCSECEGTQTIRRAETPFQHYSGCSKASNIAYPWEELRNILDILPPSTPVKARAGVLPH
jgi:hypothetical protein